MQIHLVDHRASEALRFTNPEQKSLEAKDINGYMMHGSVTGLVFVV